MIIQFRTTVKVGDDGEIQTAKVIESKNMTQDVAEMFTDLEKLHSVFTRGVVKVLTEDIEDSEPSSDDEDVDLEEDDFDDEDLIEDDEDDVDGQ